MSSACSLSLASPVPEKINRSRIPPYRTLPRSLRGPLSRVAGDLSAELQADLDAARWDGAGGPFRRASLVGLLFASAFPVRDGGEPALRAIFAAEAMRRARTMFGLVLLLEGNSWHGREPWYPDVSPLALQRELALAKTLASLFGALDADSQPCAAILTGILSAYVELFGPGIGQLSFAAEIEPLHLTGIRCRALVLAATELIGTALLYGMRRPHTGRVRTTLRLRAGRSAEFVLDHDGEAADPAPARESVEILNAMAGLLDGRLTDRGAAAIALHFPC